LFTAHGKTKRTAATETGALDHHRLRPVCNLRLELKISNVLWYIYLAIFIVLPLLVAT